MKLFKILSAELLDTKATAEQPSQKYYRCIVVADNTLQKKELTGVFGKMRLSSGGQTYVYAVLSNDPTFIEIEEWLADKAKGDEYPFIIEGDVHNITTDRAYYVINPRTNKPVMNEDGTQQIATSITFFCPASNSATTAARRIQRTLKFVAEAPVADNAAADPLQ